MQGAVAAPASYRACRSPGVEAVPCGADVSTGRGHGALVGVARRLSLSLGAAYREGTRLSPRAAAGREADSGSPLVCPRCGSEMSLIADITDPVEVGTILRHLVKIGRSPLGLDPNVLN